MQQLLISSALTAIVVAGQLVTVGQQRATEQHRLDRAQNRPDLALPYASSAKFKLASRKTRYRLGEMITLDLAMLNMTSAPVFFYQFSQPNFHVSDRRGNSAEIVPYLIVEQIPGPNLYSLLQPGEMITKSFEVLAGCDTRAFETLAKGQNYSESELFDREFFVNWGQLCLKVVRPGQYTITVEQGNNDVVIIPSESKVMTSVGVIHSTPLTIEIIR